MSQRTGSESQVLIDTETTFAVLPDPVAATKISFNTCTLGLSQNQIDSEAIRSDRNPQKPAQGNFNVAGDITFELGPFHGVLFKNAFGQVTNTDLTGGLYKHTYTLGSLPEGMSIDKGFTNGGDYFRYLGCKVNSLEFSLTTEGRVAGTCNMLGSTENIYSVPIDSSPTDYSSKSGFDARSGAITEGGVNLGVCTEFSFRLENNLDGDSYVMGGGGQRYSLPEGKVKVSGSVTALFINRSLYEKALNNTETAIVYTFTRGTGDGSLGNEKLVLTLEEVTFTPSPVSIESDAGITLNLDYTAFYDDGASASAAKLEVWNTVVSDT